MGSKTKKLALGVVMLGVLGVGIAAWASQATPTRHPSTAANLGASSDRSALISSLEQGSRVVLNTVESADWSAELGGLLNLDHPHAQAAGLQNHAEPIKVYSYQISHPIHGDFLVDTGVSQRFVQQPEAHGVPRWLVPKLAIDTMQILRSTEQLIEELDGPLQGVFLTHLHIDHISGLPAIDADVPLYTGKGEASDTFFIYALTHGIVDSLLSGRPHLQEWQAPIVNIFGDGSVFAIHAPGHTAGSTAFMVNTETGPVLLTGDASHTAWGWNNAVEPGKFSTDQSRSRETLLNLIQLVKEYPQIQVKLGHQSL